MMFLLYHSFLIENSLSLSLEKLFFIHNKSTAICTAIIIKSIYDMDFMEIKKYRKCCILSIL